MTTRVIRVELEGHTYQVAWERAGDMEYLGEKGPRMIGRVGMSIPVGEVAWMIVSNNPLEGPSFGWVGKVTENGKRVVFLTPVGGDKVKPEAALHEGDDLDEVLRETSRMLARRVHERIVAEAESRGIVRNNAKVAAEKDDQVNAWLKGEGA